MEKLLYINHTKMNLILSIAGNNLNSWLKFSILLSPCSYQIGSIYWPKIIRICIWRLRKIILTYIIAYTWRTHSKYTYCEFLDMLVIKKSTFKAWVRSWQFVLLFQILHLKSAIIEKKTPPKNKIDMCIIYIKIYSLQPHILISE